MIEHRSPEGVWADLGRGQATKHSWGTLWAALGSLLLSEGSWTVLGRVGRLLDGSWVLLGASGARLGALGLGALGQFMIWNIRR